MNNRHDKILFWDCFIALITTSYAISTCASARQLRPPVRLKRSLPAGFDGYF